MTAIASVKTVDGLKQLLLARVQQLGVTRILRTIKVMDGGSLRLVATFSPLSASAPAAYSYSYSSGDPIFLYASSTCTPSGGYSPFTYSWARVSGDTFMITSPTSATTSFAYSTALYPGEGKTGVYRCTVTDSVGQIATADITVTITVIGVPS